MSQSSEPAGTEGEKLAVLHQVAGIEVAFLLPLGTYPKHIASPAGAPVSPERSAATSGHEKSSELHVFRFLAVCSPAHSASLCLSIPPSIT